jgi:hydrogenase maturation protease
VTTTRRIIGVGNPLRGDDGVGPAVIAELATAAPPGVSLHLSSGDPFDLISTWTGADHVVVIDAARTGRIPAGTVQRWAGRPPAGTHVASHGLGLGEAVALSDALGCMPPDLVILTVEVGDVAVGRSLSPEVERALPGLRRAAVSAVSAVSAVRS